MRVGDHDLKGGYYLSDVRSLLTHTFRKTSDKAQGGR